MISGPSRRSSAIAVASAFGLVQCGEISAGQLAQHGQCLAHVVSITAEGADDVREDRLVIRAGHAIVSSSQVP